MTSAKIKSLRSLRAHMKAIARGERLAPVDAARPSFNSVAALVRLLTPDNRQLLALHSRPQAAVSCRIGGDDRASPAKPHAHARKAGGGWFYYHESGRSPQGAERCYQEDRGRNRSLFRPRSSSGCVSRLSPLSRSLARSLVAVNEVPSSATSARVIEFTPTAVPGRICCAPL